MDNHEWQVVDEGWGRQAVEFATLSEPANAREYVAMHQHLAIQAGELVLDVACGAGLALELASARGARCAGIDASQRLVDVAHDRVPQADLRVGDMHDMPWEDGTFDVVTSFRGVWGTTPAALGEIGRVLAPGGRIGITVWGHIKASPGSWALSPFRLAAPPKVANQAAMVALGRPGVAEQLFAEHGYVEIQRVTIPFAWEFADPASYARAIASTGPAFEAIQAVGEDEFARFATETAAERVRSGLPLRAEIDVVGLVARKAGRRERRVRPRAVVEGGTSATTTSATTTSATTTAATGFVTVPEPTAEAQAEFDRETEQLGFVMNATRLWTNLANSHEALFDLLASATAAAELTFRQRGIIVSACASTMGDSYCSLAWGNKLAKVAGDDLAGSVLRGYDEGLGAAEIALAQWARRVTRDPNGTTAADLQPLRDAGYRDDQIFAITLYIALRIAFSTVNDALGAQPDQQLHAESSESVLSAVAFGRAAAAAMSS